MWGSSRKNGRTQTAECDHDHRVEAAFAGLGRSVCESCGHVSLSYQYDLFEEEREQLNESEDEQAREVRRRIVKRQ